MSDSESEIYESADEDYEDKVEKTEKFQTPSKTLNKDVNKNDSNLQSDDNTLKDKNLNSETKEKEDVGPKLESGDGWDVDDWDVDDTNETTRFSEKDSKKEIDQWADFKDDIGATTKPTEEKSKKGTDQWVNFDDDTGEITKPTEKGSKTETDKWENFDAAGGNVKSTEKGLRVGTDKWDDFDDDTFEISKPTEKDSTKEIDKWDDFDDDWGESTAKKDQNIENLAKNVGKLEEPKINLQQGEKQQQDSWVWKPWGGVVSLLSTASEGVTTLSSQVSSVIEKSMGVPNPEELAKINAQALKDKQNQQSNENPIEYENQEGQVLPSLGSIVTGVTSIGNKVITGGLDTLEEIGKKTMNILQENDPLLLNKRKLLGLESEKPNLSSVLREAKEKSEEIEKNLKQIQKQSYKKQLHFETLFDHYYGLVHLEALEMLSKQSKLKLQSLLEPLSGNAKDEMEETLNEVKELCELDDNMENDENDGLYNTDELKTKLYNAIEDLDVNIEFHEILKCWKENIEWLTNNTELTATEVYEHGLRCLAETCALAMLKLHKIAELLLIKEHHSTANEADALVQLTIVLCFHLNGVANRFGSKLNSFTKSEEVSSLITSLFVEVDNSTSYVQSAFKLFIPILQIGAA